MATTENDFTGNGSQKAFPFTFEYLKTSDVKIGLTLGTGAEQVLAATEYTFPNATTLELDTISSATTWQETSGAPKSGIKVRVHRKTADDNVASTFYPGSAIRSSDLNDNFLQNLYVTQEARNITGDSTTIAEEAKALATTADGNATTALNNSRESDGEGGWTTAIAKATSASNTATSASNAVADKIDKDGSVAMTAALTLSGAPTSDLHASTKKYVDDKTWDSRYYTETELNAGQLDNRYYTETELNAGQLDNRYYTETELNAGQLDNRYYTESEADARFFTQDVETITSNETWTDLKSDTTIASSSAIDKRIIALVDNVGGFVPIATENAFPNENPDINDPATGGTIVSIASLSEDITTGSGETSNNTKAQTIGGTAVTIAGLDESTTYPQGHSMLVETTSTLNTYNFHRLLPKATEVTTLAAKATELGRLGTAAAVEDMALLGTTDCVADMAILATTDVVADLNTLATADIVADLDALGPKATDIGTCATKITDISSCAGNLSYTEDLGGIADALTTSTTSAISTVAANIDEIKSFDDTYKVASSAPSSGVTEGDLWYDSTNNALKYYNGSSWASITAGISNLIEDQTPELYAALDCNNKNLTEVATVSGDNLQIDFGAIA